MKQPYMTPARFAAERKRLLMTQQDMAHLLGVHVNTVQNYEAGRTRIPKSVAKLLENTH